MWLTCAHNVGKSPAQNLEVRVSFLRPPFAETAEASQERGRRPLRSKSVPVELPSSKILEPDPTEKRLNLAHFLEQKAYAQLSHDVFAVAMLEPLRVSFLHAAPGPESSCEWTTRCQPKRSWSLPTRLSRRLPMQACQQEAAAEGAEESSKKKRPCKGVRERKRKKAAWLRTEILRDPRSVDEAQLKKDFIDYPFLLKSLLEDLENTRSGVTATEQHGDARSGSLLAWLAPPSCDSSKEETAELAPNYPLGTDASALAAVRMML